MDDRKPGRYLIGKDSWKDWSPILTYFACIGTFLLNRRDEDHIVYKKERVVRKEAKKLMLAAREAKFHLKKRGQMNLDVVPALSDCYGIIVNVYSEKKRKIKNDTRNITTFNFERPQLDIVRTESGRFCIITKMGRFVSRQMCDDCLRPFNNLKTLWKHKNLNRCPYERFVERFPEGSRDEFHFETPMEEYMIERLFPRGRIKPHRTIEERLEDLHIYIPPNFILKQYFCVSDIESFLRPLPHKYVEGEEAYIYGDKLEGLYVY